MLKRLLIPGFVLLLACLQIGLFAKQADDPAPSNRKSLSVTPRVELLAVESETNNRYGFEPIKSVDWAKYAPEWTRAIVPGKVSPEQMKTLLAKRSEYDDATFDWEVPLAEDVAPGYYYAIADNGIFPLKPARMLVTCVFFFTHEGDQVHDRVYRGVILPDPDGIAKPDHIAFVLSSDVPLHFDDQPAQQAGYVFTAILLPKAPPGRPQARELEIKLAAPKSTPRHLVQPAEHEAAIRFVRLVSIRATGSRMLLVAWDGGNECHYGCCDAYSIFALDGPFTELMRVEQNCDP
jgi:hypothetical protein